MRTLGLVRRTRDNGCLGDKAAALTDGELGPQARDSALAHLVNCDGCRDDVAGQRRLKARLGELADPPLPAGLLDRLSALSSLGGFGLEVTVEPAPAAPRHRVRLHVRKPRLPAALDHTRPAGRSRRGVRYAIGGGVSVLALGVSAFALGGSPASSTQAPTMDTFNVEHAATTGELPFDGVAPAVTFRAVLVGVKH